MDIESINAVHTFKVLEAVKGNLAGSRNELKHFRAFLLVKGPESSPKPLNLLRRWSVVVVFCVALPVVNIDIW